MEPTITLSVPELEKATQTVNLPHRPPQSNISLVAPESQAFKALVEHHIGEALAQEDSDDFAGEIELLVQRVLEIGYLIGRHRSIQ